MIDVEVVRGKREAVYWEKVPEKVRRGAVAKVVGAVGESGNVGVERGIEEDSRQRKRRKRG